MPEDRSATNSDIRPFCRLSEGWDPGFSKPFPPSSFTRVTAAFVPYLSTCCPE
jgi:hypothetical protein